MVVIIGPEATAGSIRIFLNNIGNNKPNNEDRDKAINNERETHPPTLKAWIYSNGWPEVIVCFVMHKNANTQANDNIDKQIPFNNPTLNSL